MLKDMEKAYLQKIKFLWLLCAGLLSVPLLIVSIQNGKWFVGILGAAVIFTVAAILIYIAKTKLLKFERVLHNQEARYSITFSDEEIEILSSQWNVYLTKNWLMVFPNWAFYRDYITNFTYVEHNGGRGNCAKYWGFIETVDLETHSIYINDPKAIEKIEKWISEK